MRREFLERAARTGAARCVHCAPLDGFPGRVLEITVLGGLRVLVECHVYGHDEGGPRYLCTFDDLDRLVDAIQDLTGRPLTDWEDHTATGRYPQEPEGWTGAPSAEDEARFLCMVAHGHLRPPGFEACSSWWAAVERGPSR